MLFIETPLFTKLIQELLPDENYRLLQQTLMLRPETGDLIQGVAGCGKYAGSYQAGGKEAGCGSLTIGMLPPRRFICLSPIPSVNMKI
jgi:hypothetical protein